ncbi:hypothetical protein D8674_000194 [Pyrus ussuriensis x Pyrus communis]|uniref:Large ribosomal subunit protein uL4 C-terminal domain-containing protein n=1 Tax=Pyrus ussuriensis x Pyrus communis TaxID=2448454 RepID=A0A5N5FFT0_9ROSA|nr:hypothetical protein D8674_000194 [Pyrus ussuriensis x Pyrus communis]
MNKEAMDSDKKYNYMARGDTRSPLACKFSYEDYKADLSKIINSDDVQSSLLNAHEKAENAPMKKNPFKNALLKLNLYVKTASRMSHIGG